MHTYIAQCSEAIAGTSSESEKHKNHSESNNRKKLISTASASVETLKDVSVQNFLTLLMNQIKGVFKGQIEIQSQVYLTPDEKDKIQVMHRANFFMAIESDFDEQIDISYSSHKTSIYELMRLVSTSLFTGKNRTAVVDGEIDISKRGPFEIIPYTNIFERPNGVHTLKFLILSDTGCTNSTSSDSIFKCFTPSMIGSRNIIVNNYGGKILSNQFFLFNIA